MDDQNLHDRAGSQPGEWTSAVKVECTETSATNFARQSTKQDSQVPVPLFNRLHMTMCEVPGFEPRSFLSIDQIEALTPPLVKEELKRCIPTLSEFDLDRYTRYIATEVGTGECSTHEAQTKPPLSRTFLILVLLDMLDRIPAFVSEGFTDSWLPIDHAHFQGEVAGRRYSPSLTAVLQRCFDCWEMSDIETFISVQWVVLSPFFASNAGDVALYDFDARTIMPFIHDDLTTSSSVRSCEFSYVRKVKIHPSHHNFEGDQEKPYFALKKLYSKRIEDFQQEVTLLRQLSAVSPSLHVGPLVAFRHGTSFYSLSPWNNDVFRSSGERNPTPAVNDSLSEWVIEHSIGIAATLNKMDHESSATDVTKNVDSADIVWLSGSTGNSKPLTAVSTIGLKKLYCWLAIDPCNSPNEKRCIHPALGDDVKENSTGDAWFIGCVLLEDAAWMLHGWEGAISFSLCPIDPGEQDEIASMRDGDSSEDTITPSTVREPSTVQIDSTVGNRAVKPYLVDLLRLTRDELLNTNWERGNSSAIIVDKLRHLQQKCLRTRGYAAAFPKSPKLAALQLPAVDSSSARSHSVSVASSVAGGDSPATPSDSELEEGHESRSRARCYSNGTPKSDRTLTDVYNDELYDPDLTITSAPSPPRGPMGPPDNYPFFECLEAVDELYSSAVQSPPVSQSSQPGEMIAPNNSDDLEECHAALQRDPAAHSNMCSPDNYPSLGTYLDSYCHNIHSLTDTNSRFQSYVSCSEPPIYEQSIPYPTYGFLPAYGTFDTQHSIQPDIQSNPTNTVAQKRCLDDMTGYSDTEHDNQRKVRRKGGLLEDSTPRVKVLDATYQNFPETTKGAIQEPPEIAREDILFACPFYKRNPARYSKKYWKACFGPGWGISRLKEHIYRKHYSPLHRCSRCFVEFKSIRELDQHHRLDPRCPTQDPAPDINTIDETQKAQIQKKLRGVSDEQKWNEIYKTIFKVQSTTEIPSPYYENTADSLKGAGGKAKNADSLADFEAYLHRLVDGSDMRDVTAIRDCLNLIRSFHQTKAGESSLSISKTPSTTFDPSNGTAGFPVPVSPSKPAGENAGLQSIGIINAEEFNDPFWVHFNELFSPDRSNHG